jgi:restriction system protein
MIKADPHRREECAWMPIPNFQLLLLPMLQLASDGEVHTASDSVEYLAAHLNLTDEDLREMLPSGTQRRFENRVAWARTHLKHAGLLEYPDRARFRITERGREVLAQEIDRLDMPFLMQFPEYVAFRNGSHKSDTGSTRSVVLQEIANESVETPEEQLESGYQRLHENLSQEILTRIMQSPPSFFEQLVVDLIIAMGYGGSRKDAGEAVGRSGDGGIDGIIKEDRLGLDAVYLQAKRWDGPVSRPTVQGFAGSLAGIHATKGILITTSRFTDDARTFVRNLGMKIVLIDGEQLADLMIEYGVGVTEVTRYVVKRLDLDYFEAE